MVTARAMGTAPPCLTGWRGVLYKCHMSSLTIRISDEEKAMPAKRAKEAGVSTGALVRDLIKADPIVTSADLLKEMQTMVGAQNLRIKVRP